MKNLVEDDAQGPDINSIGVVMEFGLFWSYVLFGARNGLHDDLLSTKSEICQLDLGQWLPNHVLAFEKNVLRFQIPMGNAMVMQLLNSLADLQDAFECLLLSHFVIFAYIQGVPV